MFYHIKSSLVVASEALFVSGVLRHAYPPPLDPYHTVWLFFANVVAATAISPMRVYTEFLNEVK